MSGGQDGLASGAASATDPSDQRVVGGRYRLEHVLGRGGMGTVWAATDELLGRPVAAKEVLPPVRLSDTDLEEMRRRTMQEARAAARLSSPAVLLVLDVVEEDGHPWIIMERLTPTTLADVIDERGRLEPRDVARLGLTLLGALEAAHRAGVLHRDVKPANVMFRGTEVDPARAVLTDFGIARFEGDPSSTATGMIVGSPAFVAPERARGDAASPASDLWALGITLWIAAEGSSPFHREGTLQTLTAVLTEDLPPLEHGAALAPVLTGLLHKDPARRLTAGRARTLLQRAAYASTPSAETAPATTAVTPPPPSDPSTARQTPAAAPRSPAAAAAPPSRVPPAPSQAPQRPAPDRRRRAAVAGALAGVAALVALAVTLATVLTDDDGTPAASRPSASTPAPTTAAPSATSSSAAPTSPRPTASASATATSTPTRAATPAGFTRYTDPSGFSLAVPQGWTVSHKGARLYVRDPDSSAYLLVDQTSTPKDDAEADWKAQESSVKNRFSNYERIRIESVDYRGWEAADWEFRHGKDSPTHVLNRGFVTSPSRGYALYWSVPEAEWSQQRSAFDTVAESFQPAGS